MIETESLLASTEAEMALVGSMLLDPRRIDRVMSVITPDDFGDKLSRMAYTLIVNTHESGDAVVPEQIARKGKATEPTFFAYIGQCAVSGVASATDQYVREVRQHSIMRSLRRLSLSFSDRVSQEIEPGSNDAMEHAMWLLSKAEQILFSQNDQEIHTIGHYAAMSVERIEEAMKQRSQLGIPTGFITLDDTLGGLFPGELTTIAARPGIGKTSLGIQIARNISLSGKRGVVFSLEMTGEELAQRSLCSLAEVSSQRVRSGVTTSDEFRRLVNAMPDLDSCPLFIDDHSTRDIQQIAATCRLLASEGGLSCVVVDYVGLVKPTTLMRGRSRTEQVSEVMKGLKAIAKDLNCPVLALSQVNREAAKEGWLQLHHLKDSGSIEEDSNSVWFIQRTVEKTPGGDVVKVQIDVAKNRNGQIGVNDIRWEPEFTRFRDPEVCEMPNYVHDFMEFGGNGQPS